MSLSNDMGFVMRSHLLAASIIARHQMPEHKILDDRELGILRQFCANPAKKDEVLMKHDMVDKSRKPAGSSAQQLSSLAGHCVARHGTENPALNEEEIEMLRNWFERGGPENGHAKLDGRKRHFEGLKKARVTGSMKWRDEEGVAIGIQYGET
ncbi:hypothetical protein MMC18_008907 [Xylographa bjoerkii]|nr:hypothetical protein [Xylographa bjoerkii]